MRRAISSFLLLALTACGGGGGGIPAPPPVTSRALTVSVQGLPAGDTLTVANGSQVLAFPEDGTRTLTLDVGAAYNLLLSTTPFLDCSASNLTGTVGSTALPSVVVKCEPQSAVGSHTEQLVSATLADGLLYVADRANNQVHVRRRSDGVQVLTIGQRGVTGNVDGPAAQARFASVGPLTRSPAIGVVMADTCNHTLRVLGAEVRTLAGQPIQGAVCDVTGPGNVNVAPKDGQGGAAVFVRIWDIAAAPDGSIWVLDDASVRRVAPDGTVTTLGSSAVPSEYGGSFPARHLAVGTDGSWYGLQLNALAVVDPNGGRQLLLSYGAFNKYEQLGGLRVGPSGAIYTCLSGNIPASKSFILRLSPAGSELQRYPVATCAFAIEGSGTDEMPIAAAPLGNPVSAFETAMASARAGVLPDGRIILNQLFQNALVALAGGSAQPKVAPFGATVMGPGHVVVNAMGEVGVLSQPLPHAVTVFDAAGSVKRTVSVNVKYATDIALANDGRIAVATLGEVNLIAANGPEMRTIRLPQRNGAVPSIKSLAFDKDGALYVVASGDYLNHYLFRIGESGVEPEETNAFSGAMPSSLVAASDGKLYMLMSDQVWQIGPGGPVTKLSLRWQGPALPGLEASVPRITSLAAQGGWLYGVYKEGVMRVKLP